MMKVNLAAIANQEGLATFTELQDNVIASLMCGNLISLLMT